MAAGAIAIPWLLRLSRWRDRFVPIAVFAMCAVASVWLWDRHSGATVMYGEVEAVRAELSSAVEGVLAELPGPPLERFDLVSAGQIIARLDDRAALAALATLQAQIVQGRSEVAAAAANHQQQRADLQRQDAIDRAELALDIQRQRLDVVDRRGRIEADRVELQRLTEEFEHVQRLHDQQAETDFILQMARLRKDVLARDIAEQERSLEQAALELAASEDTFAELPAVDGEPMHALLQPLRDAIDVLESQMRQLELMVAALQIRAPFAGEVAAVHVHPGQAVVPGQPIITLSDPLARSVVVYFREDAVIWPDSAMNVAVYSRRDRTAIHDSAVVSIGSQVELVPEKQRLDPLVPEWGLPVRLEIPDAIAVRPGELVGVVVRP